MTAKQREGNQKKNKVNHSLYKRALVRVKSNIPIPLISPAHSGFRVPSLAFFSSFLWPLRKTALRDLVIRVLGTKVSHSERCWVSDPEL